MNEPPSEYDYRRTERLGMLCGDGTPTPEQERIADEEAAAWLDDGLDPETRAALERIQIKARERRREHAAKKYRPTHPDA